MERMTSFKRTTGAFFGIALGWAMQTGCSGISIQPSCPEELQVGEKGFVFANQDKAGGVAKYKWEVFPAGSGSFENAATPDTTFTAGKAADATLRLTASDGLFQVESECNTRIVATATISVTLEADRLDVEVGDQVTLTCSSPDASDTVTLTIDQVGSDDVALTEAEPGMVTFSPSQAGSLSFECVAEDADGPIGDAVPITVVVSEAIETVDETPDAGTLSRDETPSSRDDSRPSRGGDADSPDATDDTATDQGGDTEPAGTDDADPAPPNNTEPDQSDAGRPNTTDDNDPPRDNESPSRNGGRDGRGGR